MLCLELFKYQSKNNHVYRKYIDLLNINADQVSKVPDIPFLPIRFYKTHKVVTGEWEEEQYFESSGTTGQIRSRNPVRSMEVYNELSTDIFQGLYGDVSNLRILALLPSYLERGNSSLVAMVQNLINRSKDPGSGFYLNEYERLYKQIIDAKENDRPVILFGVTFALLDMATHLSCDMSNVTIIETGGMKGRGEELTRDQVHTRLAERFREVSIHSEYGMTELMSQAYTIGGTHFKAPEWMKVLIRDVTDPFTLMPNGSTGGVNVIDLANADTCAFIETEDLGRSFEDNTFEILGRFDNSEIRGCNILVS